MFSLFELVWKRIRLFFTDDEVFYIGGADVLPPPLEREQENRCLIALSGLHGDSEPMTREDARKQLIEHNLRLVVYLARKFENTGICVEDLISIGTIGLIKGINTFNPVSIDEPLNVDWDGNELLLSDILGTDEDIIYRDMENEAEIMLLRTAVNTLTPREKEIICLRYGIGRKDGSEMTQKEVADLLGISQSYISRLEKKIMVRLKKSIQNNV